MKWNALYATGNLMLHVVFRIGRRISLRKSAGLDQFLQYYREDRIVPLTVEEKSALPAFSRCISCGLCDSLCPVVKDSAPLLGPSFIPHAARSIPDFASVPWDYQACENCRGCESICPERVPIKKILSFMRSKTDGQRPL